MVPMRLVTMPRVLGAAALMGLARVAGAQLVPQVDATVAAHPAVSIAGTRPPGGAVPLLSAGLRWDAPRLSVGVAGDATAGEASRLGSTRASLLASTPAWRSIHATLTGAARSDAGAGARHEWRGAAGVQLALDRVRGGVWTGYDLASTPSFATRNATPLQVRGGRDSLGVPTARLDRRTDGRFSLGGWLSRGSLVGSTAVHGSTERVAGWASTLQTRHYVDTLGVDTLTRNPITRDREATSGDSGSTGGLRRFTDVDVRMTWSRGRASIAGAAGMRLLDWASGDHRVTTLPGSRAWATLDATVSVGRHVAVVGGIGSGPAGNGATATLVALSQPPGVRTRYATLGVRLSPTVFGRPGLPPVVRPAATTFAVRPVGPGKYAVRVRVPAARAVELSGELTAWRPVAMKRVDADAWEAVLPAAAGTYRVSIRVDGGAWVAPPGLPAVDDDFGGSAAVVVVR
jgi:hypothetical protein